MLEGDDKGEDMRKHPLWHNLFRREDWIREGAELCRENPMFENIPAKAIRWMVARMHPRSYEAGEAIFKAGNPGAGAVLLLSGEVAIRANKVELARLERGDIFGEVALVADQPRTADAICLSDCEVLFLLRSDLQEWLENRPRQGAKLLQNLAGMIARRLLEAGRQLASLEQP